MDKTQQREPTRYRQEQFEDERELMDYLRLIWKYKIVIVLMIVLCAGVSVGVTMVKYPAKHITECIISLSFPGIEKHKNPDGTLFDKTEIIAPAILSRATAFLREANEDLPIESIRGMVGVKGIIPPEIQEEMKKAEERQESYTFFPNQFSLALTREAKGLFSTEQTHQILLLIIDEYRKEFERKYAEEPLVVLNFPDDFLLDHDYCEIIDIFQIRIDNFIKFLDSKIKKAGFFRSRETGLSFIDIKNDVELVRDIKLYGVKAVIKTSRPTKNRENLISKYRDKIRNIDMQKRKKEEEALVTNKLLKEMREMLRYEPSRAIDSGREEATLVLDSSFIENLIKEDSQSMLLRRALESGIDAKRLEVDKEFLEQEIAILKEKEKEGGERERERQKIAYVQETLKIIKDRIKILAKEANALNVEYLKGLVGGAVQIVKAPETYVTRSTSLKNIVLLAGVVGLFFAIFVSFFIEYIRKQVKKTDT